MEVHSTRCGQRNPELRRPEGFPSFFNDMVILNQSMPSVPFEEIIKSTKICIFAGRPSIYTHFVKKILPKLTQPIDLFLLGSDQTFPNNTDFRGMMSRQKYPKNMGILFKHPLINKIFVENLDCTLPKTVPIPIGINTQVACNSEYYLRHENINIEKSIKFTNFNIKRCTSIQWAERHYLDKLCRKFWSENYAKTRESLSHESYLKVLSEHMFTVCAHGGGLDVNPKLWEALLVGTIPIIRKNKPYTDIYKDLDFPVVIVEDWSNKTITLEKLETWRDEYYCYFTDPDKRQDMLHKLSVDYWKDYIK